MDPSQRPPSIHHRRRWFYVLWGALLVAAAAMLAWGWETPARVGTARVSLVLTAPDIPPGTRAALWVGSAGTWIPDGKSDAAVAPCRAGA